MDSLIKAFTLSENARIKEKAKNAKLALFEKESGLNFSVRSVERIEEVLIQEKAGVLTKEEIRTHTYTKGMIKKEDEINNTKTE